ncbi:MAG: hypothetical protein M3O70_00375 [Actinomycetota bacterium]|nr:hypothetical protein [Actinomycetota bacterium]
MTTKPVQGRWARPVRGGETLIGPVVTRTGLLVGTQASEKQAAVGGSAVRR